MARPRTYRHDLLCPHCGSNWTPKDGRSRGKQTYRCRDCHYRFTLEGNRHYYSAAVKSQALDMYQEGTGITATGRVLGVKPATVFSWVKKPFRHGRRWDGRPSVGRCGGWGNHRLG